MLYFSYLQGLIHVDNIFEEINDHYSMSQRVENSLSKHLYIFPGEIPLTAACPQPRHACHFVESVRSD